MQEEHVAQFLSAYGAEGDWAQLFRRAEGFVGTELLRSADHANVFVTIDRWRSRADFERFQQRFGAEYAALDERCEGYTREERALGRFEDAGQRLRRAGVSGLGFDEAIAALPLLLEARPDGLAFFRAEGGVGLIDEAGGFSLGKFQQIAVAGEIGDAELRQAGLAGAEELTGAALGEVDLRKLEAVLSLHHGIEAGFRFGRDLFSGNQDTVATRAATAYAAA